MQLIFDSATDIDIEKNMAFIDKESVHENFSSDGIIEKLRNNDSLKSNQEYIERLGNVVVNNGKKNEKDCVKNTDINGLNKSVEDSNISSKSKEDKTDNHNMKLDVNEEIKEPHVNKNLKLEYESENKSINNLDSDNFQQNDDTNEFSHASMDVIHAENNEYRSNLKDTLDKQVLPVTEKESKCDEKLSNTNLDNNSIKLSTGEQIHNELKNNDSLNSEKILDVEIKGELESKTFKSTEKDLTNTNTELISEGTETNEIIDNIDDNLQKSQEKKLVLEVSETNISDDVGNSDCVKPNEFSIGKHSLEAQNNEDKTEADTAENNTASKEEDSVLNEPCVQGGYLDKKLIITCNNVKTESDPAKDDSKITPSDKVVKSEDKTKKHSEISKSIDSNTNTIEINDDSSQDNDVSSKIENEESKTGISDDDNIVHISEKNDNYGKSIDAINTNKNNSISVVQDIETEKIPEKHIEKSCDSSEIQAKLIVEKTEEPQTLPLISKLSNTLDILSDDEVTTEDNKLSKINIQESNKQCINIEDEDDDDIMLIDDEGTSKVSDVENIPTVVTTKEENEIVEENKVVPEDKLETSIDSCPTVEGDTRACSENTENSAKTETAIKQNEDKATTIPKPLLPRNFVSACKKNLAEMTRNDLEEFCILKIVESVVDRGNLGEIKSQLKKLTLSVEEHKNKAKMLTKQNQDLQVVLRSVQEELRNNSPITPLKITRSVGIQVLMSDKSKRKPQTTQQNNSAPAAVNKPQRSPVTPNNRSQKQSAAPQQIPVPRLVLAKNVTNSTVQTPTPISKMPSNSGPPAPVRPSAQKPEKRPYSKTQSGSDTVDLTDDEPPQKVIGRPNINQSVRVISPQNLMPPQRPQMSNSPRKVYIPISGAQSPNVRPGQAYMLKTITSQNIRQRVPPLRRLHPAPLPESSKQYQPPNWKEIPPAPEIKLSKVENGIVISWKLDSYQEDIHENIASYQIYAYQETQSPPSTNLWKKIGDVKALPLPMACTLTQFVSGYKYYFAVRAVDVRSRQGNFSLPGNIMLMNK